MAQWLRCNGIVEWMIRNVNYVIFVMARVSKYGKTWRFNWFVYCLGTNAKCNLPPSSHQTPYWWDDPLQYKFTTNLTWVQIKVRKKFQSFKNVRTIGGKGGAHMLIASNYQKMWNTISTTKETHAKHKLKAFFVNFWK